MNWLKRVVTGIGGVVMAALLLTVVAPKTVHAVASALVTVANTTANPVPIVAADNPARTAVWLSGSVTLPSGDFQATAPLLSSSGSSFVVPNGQRLVVDYVSGHIELPQGEAPFFLVVYGNSGTAQPAPAIYPVVGSGFSNGVDDSFNVSAPTTAYFDPGTTVLAEVARGDSTIGDGTALFYVYGHLVSLQ